MTSPWKAGKLWNSAGMALSQAQFLCEAVSGPICRPTSSRRCALMLEPLLFVRIMSREQSAKG
jgi:hypothetical protein